MLRAGFINPFTNEPDISCDNSAPAVCRLQRACSNYDWQFAFSFTMSEKEYGAKIFVPLSAFAIDNLVDDTCDLYV